MAQEFRIEKSDKLFVYYFDRYLRLKNNTCLPLWKHCKYGIGEINRKSYGDEFNLANQTHRPANCILGVYQCAEKLS